MAASNPLHRDASASRQPSSHSLHGITASNAALPSRKHEGLVGPLRPWSGSHSCGAPPKPANLDPSHLRAPHTLMLGRRPPHAQGPCACGAVLGFVRRPPCGERQGSRIKCARASKGVKRDRTGCPPNYISPHATRETVSPTPRTTAMTSTCRIPLQSVTQTPWHGCEQPAAQGRVRIAPAKQP